MFARMKNRNLVMVSPLAFALMIAYGCGSSKKAVYTSERPAPQPVVEKSAAPAKPEEKIEAPVERAQTSLVLETVYFDYDKYELTNATRNVLARHAQELQKQPNAQVVIEGHCDERGTIEHNLALGEKRARAIKEYLAALGVARARMNTISYGKERPVDYAQNEAAWSKNRRGEFVVRFDTSATSAY